MSRVRKDNERKPTMLSRRLKIGSGLVCILAIPAISGCAHSKAGTATVTASSKHKPGHAERNNKAALTGATPLYAEPGECYAPVFVPPEFDTVMERVCVREESEKLEIIPAKYEWVEERVLVREASTKLIKVPARFDVRNRLVQTSPGHATWIKANTNQVRRVADTPGPLPPDIFCLVSEPPTTMTVQMKRMVKGPKVKEVAVPAKYQTIRWQKLVRPAMTRRITIPAEYREVKKIVIVAPGRMEWQRVGDCDPRDFRVNRKGRTANHRNRQSATKASTVLPSRKAADPNADQDATRRGTDRPD